MSRQQMMDEQQRQEEEMSTIAAAFIKAKLAFAPALKDKTNPAFRSKYADLGACIEAVNEALLNNGIAFYQETSLDDSGVTVETVLLHESGGSIRSGKLHVPASKQDPQGYGSALTYARRYSLMTACGIAPEDDDGNGAKPPAPKETAQKPAPDSLVEAAKNAAMEGTEDFRKYWAKLSKEAREQLRSHLPALQKAAEAADKVPA